MNRIKWLLFMLKYKLGIAKEGKDFFSVEVFKLCECNYKKWCTGSEDNCNYISSLEIQYGQEITESILQDGVDFYVGV